jgi:hypothetical protein
MVYFNGNYVAVSSDGTVMSSPDGANWTQTPLPGRQVMTGIASNGTTLLAVGLISFSSTDGVNWQSVGFIPGAGLPRAITWTGNLWFAVGDAGMIDTSPDGSNWTTQASGFSAQSFNAVEATNSTYVAVGTNATINISVDGVIWHSVNVNGNIATSANLTGIAYDPDPGNQRLVAVASGFGVFASSDQGQHWSSVPAPVGNWQNVRWFENLGLFIVVGGGETMMTSHNGTNWTVSNRSTIPAFTRKSYTLRDVAVNPGGTQALAVGDRTTLFTSSNYTSWQQVYSGIFTHLTAIASDGAQGIVEVGNLTDQGSSSTLAAFSTDGGATWGAQILPSLTVHNSSAPFLAASVAYSPLLGAYVAVGNNNGVALSVNGGASWTIVRNYNINSPLPQAPPFNAVAWTGNCFVAVANAPTSSQASYIPTTGNTNPSGNVTNIQFSLDGINWYPAGIGAGITSFNLLAVASNGNNRVVAIGQNAEIAMTNHMDLGTSALWFGGFFDASNNLSDIAYGNGLWVAVGNHGAVFSAPDGANPDSLLNWTLNTLSGVTEDLNSVIFTNGSFYIFGAAGDIYQSTDAVTWVRCLDPVAGLGIVQATVTSSGLALLSTSNTTYLGALISPSAPSIATANLSVLSGQSANFAATFSGNPTPALFWQLSTDGGATWANLTNGSGISGATTNTLTINHITTPLNGQQFRAIATNSLGTATSDSATLTVNPLAPNLTSSPGNLTIIAGQPAQFGAAATGDPAPSFHWQSSSDGGSTWANLTDDGNTTGSATANLSLANVTFAFNNHQFRALAFNTGGTVASAPAILTVDTSPAFFTQPGNHTVSVGQVTNFSTIITGNPAPALLWQVSSDGGLSWSNLADGNGIVGSNTSVLQLANPNLAMTLREFRLVAVNVVGSTFSNAAVLTVLATPAITSLSSSLTAVAGANVTLSVNAGGSLPLKYQWLFNGRLISGATSAILTLPKITTARAGNYSVIVTNASGKITSVPITLSVILPPTLTKLAKSLTVRAGSTTSLTITAAGTKPFTYQWKYNGVNATASNISGATTPKITITKATPANTGAYLVIVTNAAGSTPSSSVMLTVK